MVGWKVQFATDLERNGLALELFDVQGHVVAEVFRCDDENSVVVNTFNNTVPLLVIEWFLRIARERLAPFDDGTPFPVSK